MYLNDNALCFSLDDTWLNCLEGAADFKELIPEFYEGNGEFLLNKGVRNYIINRDLFNL